MSDDNFFSKKGQRKISLFIGHELLYDYMTGRLDSERTKAVEDFIAQNKEVQSEMNKIQLGMNYVAVLSETKVSEALVEKIQVPTSYIQSVLIRIRFNEWPPLLRLALESSVIAFGISLIAIFVPWRTLLDLKLGSDSVVLSEVDNQLMQKSLETEISKEDLAFPDEGSAAEMVTTTSLVTPSTVVVKAEAVKAVPATTASPSTTLKLAAAVQVEKATEEDKKGAGFLYRGNISIANAKGVAPKIVDKISSFGARKAGNVELGWSKGKGAYFHFTIPESRYEEMMGVFKEYGNLKISKEKHERLMPEGIVRVIITVDEKN